MKKMTQQRIRNMHASEQIALFLEDNKGASETSFPGPSMVAQTQLHNNWKQTLENWIDRQPLKD